MPRSPRWLASKDRWEEAIQVLADLHAGGDIEHPKVLAEYQEIEEALRFEREEAKNSFAALIEKRMIKRVVLGMSIQMWSQLCGMNIMMYYIYYIMEAASIGSPLLTASIQYIINVVLTLPAILYIDKWGRRPTLLLGSFGMMICLFISGAVQASYGRPLTQAEINSDKYSQDLSWIVTGNKGASGAIVACSYLFVAIFASTWGPASWCYPAEIFPSKVRTKAVSIATASNWLANGVLGFAVPPLLHHINWKMYMIFATFNGLALIHLFIAAPETKGKMLEEMDDVFEGGLKAWQKQKGGSRLEELTRRIEEGVVKVPGPAFSGQPGERQRRTSSTTSLRGRDDVSFPAHRDLVRRNSNRE